MSRQYIHLSNNIDTAIEVGKRHGDELIIFKIDVKKC
jgi:putative RNA 2'-phosphotransferase